MKITKILTTPVAIPIEAPLRHSAGVHPYFTRTIVEIFTDEGIVGLGECPHWGGPEMLSERVTSQLIGLSPYHLERIYARMVPWENTLILNVYAAIEFACLDIQGKAAGVPVSDILGGKVRDEVSFAAYVFYRYCSDKGVGGETTPEEIVAHTKELIASHGFRTVKLKAGVFAPEYDLETVAALRESLGPSVKLRIDPNAVWSVETAIRIGKQLEPYLLEYYEDPTPGIPGMSAVGRRVDIPLATNMCVATIDDIATAFGADAIQVLLSDPHYWGGLVMTKKLATVCRTLGWGIGMHSGVEMGISMAAMLHVAATMPTLSCALDAHYHHMADDIIDGGKFQYVNGNITVPDGPGLGVALERDKVESYHRLYLEKARAYDFASDSRNENWFNYRPRY